MIRTIELTNLTSQKSEVNRAVDELNNSADPEKTLLIKAHSTSGTIPEAMDLVEKIHTSSVDLLTEASGELSPAGLLIVAAGRPKSRKAHYSTIFKLKDKIEEGQKGKIKDPFASNIVETLGQLGARKSELAETMKNQQFITAVDAKRLKIIDDAGLVKNKYKDIKKKTSEKEVDATQTVAV